MISVTFPLSEEVFSNLETIDQEEYSVDVSKIDFGEEDDVVESSMIYIRNLQLTMSLDFSNVSYDVKSKWLLTYLIMGIFSVEIKCLSETWLTVLAGENIELESILNDQEIIQFRKENKELIDDIMCFLVSIDDLAFILLDNADNKTIEYNETDLEIIKDKPKYFDCLIHIIKNYPIPVEGIRIFYSPQTTHKIYDYAIKNMMESNNLYEAIMNLPYVKILGQIYSVGESLD